MSELRMPLLSEMTEEQLQAAAVFDAEAVDNERERRSAFTSDEEMFSALAQAGVDLQAVLATATRTSPWRNALVDSGIVPLLQRAVATARSRGVTVESPKLPE